ncbi:hypothetical protein [Cryptosporangium arvum]|nr:hypothetical protein [Cryptosporangium arvum]
MASLTPAAGAVAGSTADGALDDVGTGASGPETGTGAPSGGPGAG